MKYDIIRTDKASEQLRDILFYIESDSGVEVALKYLDKIEKSINKLIDFPELGCVPHYNSLKKKGYRVLIIERHLVFYRVFKEQGMIIIYSIMDARREYLKLID